VRQRRQLETEQQKRQALRQLLQEQVRLAQTPFASRWQADTILPADVTPAQASRRLRPAQAVLITGTSGYLGAFVLADLLRTSTVRAHCLVRARDAADGLRRIRDNLQVYGIWDDRLAERITPVLGDLSQPQLGLSPDTYARLSEEIDAIHHIGFAVNFLLSYDDARQTNVGGTIEILRFACHGHLKPLHFASTFALFATARYAGNVVEEADVPRTSPGIGYAETKCVAEMLVATARARGVPVSVYRAPFVAWHSVTGIFNKSDAFCRLIDGCLQTGLAPELTTRYPILPVDAVSRAMVTIAGNGETLNKNYHVLGAKLYPWASIVDLLRQAGVPLTTVSYERWLQEVRRQGESNSVYALLNAALGDGSGARQTYLEVLRAECMPVAFDATETRAALGGDEALPELTPQAFAPFLRRLRAS
jgi:thioester reductase-like protein